MAVEVRSWFLKELDIDMPVLKVLGGSSIVDLLEEAIERLPTSVFDMSTLEAVAPSASKNFTPAPPAFNGHISVDPSTIGSTTEASSVRDGTINGTSTPSNTSPSSDSEEVEPSEEIEQKQHLSLKLGWRDTTLESATESTEKMSFGQTRFWFLNHFLKDKKSFNMAVMFRLTGPMRVNAMKRAVEVIAKRHEALRTRFFWSGENEDIPTQGILSKPLVRLEERFISTEAEAEKELDEMYNLKWNLQDWESAKFLLLTLSDNVHYIVVGCHHIALDGVSFSLLFVDLEAAYTNKPLSPLPIESQYRAFAAQQRRDYEEGRMRAAIDYYRSVIPVDIKPIPLFPFAKVQARQTLERYSSQTANFRFEPELASRIKQTARKCRSTSFHVYLAALQALMFRHVPDMNDLFIGIADANRTDKKYMDSLGFFLNLLPLRFDRSNLGTTFSDAVQAARNQTYRALEHSTLPFDVLLDELNVPRSGSHTPVFQVFMDYRQVVQERARFGECITGDERWCNARIGYDVALEVTENPTGETLLSLRLQEALYSKSDTDALLHSYVNMLEEFSKTPELAVDTSAIRSIQDTKNAVAAGSTGARSLEMVRFD